MASNARSIKRAAAKAAKAKAERPAPRQEFTIEEAIRLAPVTEIPTGLAIQLRELFANAAAIDTLTVRDASDLSRALNKHIVEAVTIAQQNAEAASKGENQ